MTHNTLPQPQFAYDHIDEIPFSPYFAVWSKEDNSRMALMNRKGELLTPFEIESCDAAVNNAIVLETAGKFGMFYYDGPEVYVKPEYDDISVGGVDEYHTFVRDGKEGRVTNDLRFVSDEDFTRLSDADQDELTERFLFANEPEDEVGTSL